jgi:hypothetical protein
MKLHSKLLYLLSTFTAAMLVGAPAMALFSTVDTADNLAPGQYSMGLEPQLIFDQFAGLNAIAHFDMGVNESSGLKFLAGSGSTAFQAGGFYKLVPIPDYKNQPGIGFFAGVLYANKDTNSSLHLRVHPLISKQFQTETSGNFTPYVAIPFGVSFWNGTTTYPVQLAVGTRWLPPAMKHTNFLFEAGFNLSNAFNYISAMISVPFDNFDAIRFD